MADGEVKIDTKLDTSGLDKGLRSVKNKVNNTTKDLNKGAKNVNGLKTVFNETGGAASSFASKMGSVAESGGAVAAGITAAILAAKKYIETLKQANEAYKVQEKAESALQKAAENNPYLNSESVQHLKDYASEIQSISNFGDEGTIDVMAQLATAGRTESEIMKLVSAAADYAAAKHISLESAVQNLNKSYGGLAGELGELFPEVKALTAEQLKNGEAVDIIAQKYKGFAQEAADSGTQTKNAFGDFMESLGRLANPTFEALSQKSKAFWESMTEHMNNFNAALEKARETWVIGGDYQWSKGFVKGINEALKSVDPTKKTMYLEDNAESLTDENIRHLTVYLEAQKKLTYDELKFLKILEKEKTHRENRAKAAAEYTQYLEKWRGASKEELQTRQEALIATGENIKELKAVNDLLKEVEKQERENQKEQQKTADDDAAEYIKANIKALQEQIKAMALKASVTGEEVEAGEMYNAYMQSYIDLITQSNGLITENNQAAKERLATLQEWAQKAKDAATEEERLAAAQQAGEAALQAAESLGYNSKFDEYKAREEELLQMKKDINAAEIEDADKKRQAIENIDEELVKNRRNLWNNIASEVNGYSQQVEQIINDAAQMALETENNKMRAELANLEIKYRKGELGEEEYQKKVAEAKKKGAKIQYQIEMAQWASNILAATANTAVGVTQALAQGGFPAGIIMGALVGAAGAVQLASIMAAKPIKHFAAGGFVGGINGASMGADNTTIAARSGELVMNANQQRALWDMLNGTGNAAGTGGVNLTINNSAANLVNVQPQITRGQIELMIDARVNDGLKSGRFNSGLNAANAGMSGEFYGI